MQTAKPLWLGDPEVIRCGSEGKPPEIRERGYCMI